MTAALRLIGGVRAEPVRGSVLDRVLSYPGTGVAQLRTWGDDGDDLASHRQRYGARPSSAGRHADELLDALERAALSGRGGAHFPAARKWRSVRAAGGGGTVVANGAEGEPASAKDAALLQHRPHLVLDGVTAAAETLGADEAVVWLHEEAHLTRAVVTAALAERRGAGLPDVPIRVATTPGHYLAGESSAVLRALSGGPSLPEFRLRPSSQVGLAGRPTLLHNVETLARVALTARGLEPSGSLLTVVVGGRRVVLEADESQTLSEVVSKAGWSASAPPQAVLVGGYGGRWLSWEDAAGLRVTDAALRAAGASLGAGVLAPLPVGGCGLAETATVLSYLAASGARQCGPCRFGLPAIAEIASALARGEARTSDLARLQRVAGEVTGRGACHHPDGAVALLASALTAFADDVVRHGQGRCPGADLARVLPVPGEE